MRKTGTITGIILLVLAGLLLFAFPVGPVTDVTLAPLYHPAPAQAEEPEFPAGTDGYLIVAPDSLLALGAMQSFIAHKRGLGFAVETVSVEEIEKKHRDGERADRIRRYLKDSAERLGLRCVLLVGDPDPADRRVALPVGAGLPPFVVSAPSRSIGGTYATDKHDGEIASEGQDRAVILTGPNLQVLRPGTLRYWYVNCTKPGKIRLVILRKKGETHERVFASEFTQVTVPGVAIRSTMPVQLQAGDFLGFQLPSEGAATVAAVNTPGVTNASLFLLRNSDTPELLELSGAAAMETLPLLQCSVFFEPHDTVGALPSKMCWPMGTYNGVYGALARDSCLSQCPTDAYYANLTGDWDRNGNGFFGETFLKFFRYDGGAQAGELSPGDFGPDADSFLPEILVGRIPFDDPETVSAVLEKTIAYETSQDKEWRRHCLLGADPLAPDTDNYALCELIKHDICGPAAFKVTRFYTEHDFEGEVQSPKRYSYEPEALVTLKEIEDDKMAGYERFSRLWATSHPGLVLWSSHANTDICRNIITLRDEASTVLPRPVTRRYVGALDDTRPAVVFAAACSLTQQERYYLGLRKKRTELSHDWEPRPNLGRELLRNGAVAVVGPTRSTWFRHGWDSVDDGGCLSLAYYFAERLLGGESVGCSLGAAVRDYHTRWGSELAEGENLIGFVLYGDPSLTLGLGRKAPRPLLCRPSPPRISLSGPADPEGRVKIKVAAEGEIEMEAGVACEIDTVRAGADGSEEWFTARGFRTSERRYIAGGRSYYSGTARHRPSTLTLNLPLLPGQDLEASFDCWYQTEPGLDYIVLEKSPDGTAWEPLAIYSGASTDKPLFEQHGPTWLKEKVRIPTGEAVAYLRLRYETNDQYRKTPHEGFYMDNFTLEAGGGKVRYISGWQRVGRASEPGAFTYKPPGAGLCYLLARASGPDSLCPERSSLYLLTVSEPRNPLWQERIRAPGGLLGCICGLAGLFFLLVAAMTRPSSAPTSSSQ